MPEDFKRIPSYDLGRILHWRRKLENDVIAGNRLLGETLDGDVLTQLVISSMMALKIPSENEFAVRQTLMPFVSQEITVRTAYGIATKLAGNIKILREGKAAIGQLAKPAWRPVEITEMRYGRVKYGKTQLNMTVMIMADVLAGLEVLKELSYKMASWSLANELAWSIHEMHPIHTEMVRMWFMAYLVPDGNKLDVERFYCVGSQKKYNRLLRKKRSQPCIQHLSHRCQTCPVGYDICNRGTHRCSWIIKPCRICKKEHAIFDPERPDVTVCITCRTRESRTNWMRERMSAE